MFEEDLALNNLQYAIKTNKTIYIYIYIYTYKEDLA